jgi:hypothetical protein
VRLEQSLILNRYFHSLFIAKRLEELKQSLNVQEGPAGDGQTYFYGALVGRMQDSKLRKKLAGYDARIIAYETRLAKARGSFSFKYFQYLSLLYTEIFLDGLTEDPNSFLNDLNSFLNKLRKEEPVFQHFPAFMAEDLRRLAFFMATGSGKTLLLHVNFWQMLFYLEKGRHPEALLNRPDRRREFDSILLITPNEGLSQQHLDEFKRSGIDAQLLIQDNPGQRTIQPRVKVIEIHKLAEEPSKEGVSVLLEEMGSANLVFVDEGHKGAGSEAQTWKTRQRFLSSHGFLMEYSATFAQAIGAASRRVQESLLGEYGKTILFDYSYRHFYDDGYGKDFRVLNLERARETRAQDLLLGGLLSYYQQLRLFKEKRVEFQPYNLEKPLWVFLGSSVNAVYSREGQKRSDVATVVAFLRRFLEEPAWAAERIGRVLKGESGFKDEDTQEDLFASHLTHLKDNNAESLYKKIAADIFHGRGGLEVWELKNAEGEFALKVSAPEAHEAPYFGVINIGDVSAFKKHLEENLGIETRDDRFTPSLFREVNAPDSQANILIGAKKFIEGWSSWRVSSMGLLNIGKGEGPQVIQLFGRGVRLKGKDWTLKRSKALQEEGQHPEGLPQLETLFIFGWNADYIKAFRQMLEKEELSWELPIPVKTLFPRLKELSIPQPRKNYKIDSETWILTAEPLHISVDLTPRVTSMSGVGEGAGHAAESTLADFSDPVTLGLLDLDSIYTELLGYKIVRNYGNVFIPRSELISILRQCSLIMPSEDLLKPSLFQEGALGVLKNYLDRFVSLKEREAESRHLEPGVLMAREKIIPYTVRVTGESLLKEIKGLLLKPTLLYSTGDKPLPRLHIDRHLFSPLLLNPEDFKIEGLSVSPPGLNAEEAKLVKDLRNFWAKNHNDEPYRNFEIYFLRNLPRVGVGFFRRSGFYPDFILWIKDKSRKEVRIKFIEPHGLHHGGLAGNTDKMDALRDLEEVSKQKSFRKKKVSMTGYLLTQTELKEIPDVRDKNWEDLERDYPLLRQEGKYIKKILDW